MTEQQQQGRHVASERAEQRGQAHTAQPATFLTREALLDAMVEAAKEPAVVDALAEGILARMGHVPSAQEIASAIEEIRSGKPAAGRKARGQADSGDDEQRTRG